MTESDVTERTVPLRDGLVDHETLERLRAIAELALLPDRVLKDRGHPVAAFRPDTAELRAELSKAEVGVTLATPPDAEVATSEEHAADWVLPVVLFLGSIPVGIVTGIVGNWISNK